MTKEEEEYQDIYKEFGISNTATTQEIKTKYRKLLLELHPDKNTQKDQDELKELSLKFQRISEYYKILIDPSRRSLYDKTGKISQVELDGSIDYKEYFDLIFTKLDSTKIDEFEKVYTYSEEERNDVISAYIKTKGDLLKIIDHVPFSSIRDLDRFKSILQKGIDSGELQEFKKFPKVNQKELKKRIKEAEQEAEQAEELLNSNRDEDNPEAAGSIGNTATKDKQDSLMSIIKEKNKRRLDQLISNMEEKAIDDSDSKHMGKGKGKRSKKQPSMPSEEEFMELQKKLFGSTS